MAYQGVGSEILKAGDYKLERLTITSNVTNNQVDLRGLYTQFEIFEDIFSPVITAKLYIDEAFNMPERLPISGQETVELIFKSDINDMEPVKLTMRVYKLDSQEIGQNGKSQKYILHLMSNAGYLNYSQFCGYSVKGSVSDMVSTVFQKHFPEYVWKDRLDVESTKDNYSFVLSGAFTPFKALNWLANKAHSQKSNDYSPFMFYETFDGYKFKSLSKIIEDGTKKYEHYIYLPPNLTVSVGEDETVPFQTILPTRYHKIQKLKEQTRFDKVSSIGDGLISSRMVVHDLLRKEQRYSQFFEGDLFADKIKLGTEPTFKKENTEMDTVLKTGAMFYYMPSTPYTVYTQGNQIVDNFQTEEVFLRQKHHRNSLFTQKVTITVFGDSRRRVGDVVNLSVQKIQTDTHYQDDRLDKNLSGDYLITSAKHLFNTAYSIQFELSKTCMGV
jgi:hypothetical protein